MARRLRGNKRNFEGKEASQFKADVEALQASNIFVLASKWQQKLGN